MTVHPEQCSYIKSNDIAPFGIAKISEAGKLYFIDLFVIVVMDYFRMVCFIIYPVYMLTVLVWEEILIPVESYGP